MLEGKGHGEWSMGHGARNRETGKRRPEEGAVSTVGWLTSLTTVPYGHDKAWPKEEDYGYLVDVQSGKIVPACLVQGRNWRAGKRKL